MENIYVKLARHARLETERLILRPVTLEDAPAMFEYSSDEENTRYTFETKAWKKHAIISLSFIWLILWDAGE